MGGWLLDKSAKHMTLGIHVGDTWELSQLLCAGSS
jgi:hypothetical protein